jgi:hypothetical protein
MMECRLGKRRDGLATKRRGSVRQLDFADFLTKCMVMVIIVLDQNYFCRAGLLQIGKWPGRPLAVRA